MSINKYKPHLHVLPEDDANRQIANGFILDPHLKVRSIQPLPVAGGWKVAVEDLKQEHVPGMLKYPERRLLLLIDFDNDYQARFSYVRQAIGETELIHRVFVLGTLSEPESLKTTLGMSFESIGKALAEDCAHNDTQGLWAHDLLKHNEPELVRMIPLVKGFLFQQKASFI
jgi:hypothetical protein